MKKSQATIVLFFVWIAMLFLASCSPATPQVVEVTREVPQTHLAASATNSQSRSGASAKTKGILCLLPG